MDKKLNIKRRKRIGNLLHIERNRNNKSQEYIAQKLDVRQDQISKIESGMRRIDIAVLIAYCEALGYTLTQFAAKIETYLHAHKLIRTQPNMKYQRGLCTMEIIRVDVSWCDNCYKASYGENIPWTLDFTAMTFPELQKEALACLASHVKRLYADGKDVPEWLSNGEYEFQYKFLDARSLLTAYGQSLTLVAISRASGINQSLLSLYAHGKKKARPHQVERIANAINKIGIELMSLVP